MNLPQYPPAGRQRIALRLFVAAAVLASCLVPVWAGERSAGYRAAIESISAETLFGHVEHLADDAFEGREAGTDAARRAAEAIVASLEELGIPPAGTDGYYQEFDTNYRNVLARLEGSDPELRGETIVVGAHYDHIGFGTKQSSRGQVGEIHNGADDNASGVAAVLELAEAFSLLPEPPPRSILFALWDAEEKGLLGSRHWVAHPTVPLESVRYHFNIDMIGRLRSDEVHLLGARSGFGVRRLFAEMNGDADLSLRFPRGVPPISDHHPFVAADIPAVTVHTGIHEDYHRPTDTAEQIDREGMWRVTRFAFAAVHELASAAEVPAFRAAATSESRSRPRAPVGALAPPDAPLEPDAPPHPQKPLRVGITWEVDDAEPGAVVLTHVVDDSPAARAGLKAGDYVYAVDGEELSHDDLFRERMHAAEDRVELRIDRAGRIRTIAVEIDAPAEVLQQAA